MLMIGSNAGIASRTELLTLGGSSVLKPFVVFLICASNGLGVDPVDYAGNPSQDQSLNTDQVKLFRQNLTVEGYSDPWAKGGNDYPAIDEVGQYSPYARLLKKLSDQLKTQVVLGGGGSSATPIYQGLMRDRDENDFTDMSKRYNQFVDLGKKMSLMGYAPDLVIVDFFGRDAAIGNLDTTWFNAFEDLCDHFGHDIGLGKKLPTINIGAGAFPTGVGSYPTWNTIQAIQNTIEANIPTAKNLRLDSGGLNFNLNDHYLADKLHYNTAGNLAIGDELYDIIQTMGIIAPNMIGDFNASSGSIVIPANARHFYNPQLTETYDASGDPEFLYNLVDAAEGILSHGTTTTTDSYEGTFSNGKFISDGSLVFELNQTVNPMKDSARHDQSWTIDYIFKSPDSLATNDAIHDTFETTTKPYISIFFTSSGLCRLFQRGDATQAYRATNDVGYQAATYYVFSIYYDHVNDEAGFALNGRTYSVENCVFDAATSSPDDCSIFGRPSSLAMGAGAEFLGFFEQEGVSTNAELSARVDLYNSLFSDISIA